jgi:hypothetical protein
MSKLTKEDVVEMLECYEYYRHSSAPMNHADIAHVFEVSLGTVKKVFAGTHPLCDGYKKPDGPKRAGRKKGTVYTHCKRGHPLEGDNVYSYVDNNGNLSRRCRLCQKARTQEWKARQ